MPCGLCARPQLVFAEARRARAIAQGAAMTRNLASNMAALSGQSMADGKAKTLFEHNPPPRALAYVLLRLSLFETAGAQLVTDQAVDQAAECVIDATTSDLVERVRAGDRGALGKLYEAHHIAVRGFAQRLVGDAEVAEDMVHETFLSLPKTLRRFRGDASLRSFLIGVALNHARHYVRAAARRRKAMAKLAQHVSDGVEGEVVAPSPAQALQQGRLAAHLWRALDDLSLDHRAVFVLSELEQHSCAEVAALVGASEGTVRSRLFYAKQKLRERLRDLQGELS